MSSLPQKLAAETLGTAFLLATVVGSGIMAAKLAGGNTAIALLGNTLPTGAILVVLISTLGPVSGAHFNPLVSLAALVNRTMKPGEAFAYIAGQAIGALLGVVIAHAMFDLPLLQASTTMRNRQRPMACRGRGQLRPARRHFPQCTECSAAGGPQCRPLHHRRLLVHRLHQLCQSRRHPGPLVLRYICRESGMRTCRDLSWPQLAGAALAVAADRWLWKTSE